MIEVKNLTKRYGSHLAVDHLNFTVDKGRIYGFLGPNGAGKSTTMNIMTGYLGATEGQVLINGHDVLKEPEEAKRSIGYLPEIIILDEPTVGLDPKQIIEIRELIRKLAKNHTVILSSHILAEVREICDYVMIIAEGKMVASDMLENLEMLMSRAGQIEIEARVRVDQVKAVLNKINKIKNVTYRSSSGGITTAQIETKKQEDIREELFQAFAKSGVSLLTLKQDKTTLEEIFLKLTQGKGKVGSIRKGDRDGKISCDGYDTGHSM